MAEVDPDNNEEAKVGTNDDRVKVIEGLGGLQGLRSVYLDLLLDGEGAYRQEEIADIVRDVDCNAHVCEVEAVTQRNKCKRDNMMANELFEVLPRLLQLQHEDEGLLGPVTRLQQIVGFEDRFMRSVWESLKHSRRIKVPKGTPRHHVQAEGPKDGKVHGSVHLLHKSALLVSASNAIPEGKWSDEALHEELAREAEDDGVEGDEGDVVWTLAIHGAAIMLAQGLWWVKGVSVVWGEFIGKEDGFIDGVGFCRVDGIGREDDEDENERI